MSRTIKLKDKLEGVEQKMEVRFIGFIKDDEFNALIQNVDDVAARLESKATQDVLKVAAKFDDLAGHRIAAVVKKVDGKSVLQKMLYVSERLTMIDSVVPRDEKGKWNSAKVPAGWGPKPGKVTFQTETEENIVVEESE